VNRVSPPVFEWETGFADYCQAVTVSGPTVFLSGAAAFGPDGKIVGAGDVEAQLRQAFANAAAVLEAAGSSLEAVARVTTYILDPAHYDAFTAVRSDTFEDPFPASVVLVVKDFTFPEMLCEVEMIAGMEPRHR
jgi:enamine deaminase RidA (YjgF/YER057c/UK114 family)